MAIKLGEEFQLKAGGTASILFCESNGDFAGMLSCDYDVYESVMNLAPGTEGRELPKTTIIPGNNARHLIALEGDETVLGTLSFIPAGKMWGENDYYIRHISTRIDRQNSGIAKAMMLAAFKASEKRDMKLHFFIPTEFAASSDKTEFYKVCALYMKAHQELPDIEINYSGDDPITGHTPYYIDISKPKNPEIIECKTWDEAYEKLRELSSAKNETRPTSPPPPPPPTQ